MKYQHVGRLLGVPLIAFALLPLLARQATADATAGATTATVAEPAAALPPELVEVQRNLWKTAFTAFVSDLRNAKADANLGDDLIAAPAFDEKLSRNDWLKAFTDQVVKERALSPTAARALEKKAEGMFTSYYHDQGFARVPYLQPFDQDLAPAPVRKTEKLKLADKYPGNHTLDVPAYVAERFPIALQDFVTASHVGLDLDDSNCADAFSYQKTQGYTRATRFMGARDNWESQFIFVYNPQTKSYRLAICDIHGEDDKTRILAILGPVFKGQAAEFVRHRKPAPLFNFTDEGDQFNFDGGKTRVIIGFQNTVWWQLKTSAPEWERRALTKGGAEVALFENKETKDRLVSVANVYGDEMLHALEILHKKGARSFVYLGTGGALNPDLQIGDLLIPNRFLKPNGKWVRFNNDADKVKIEPPSPAKRVSNTAQGWVGTLIEETKDHLVGLKKTGVDAIDVESRYFAEFLMTNAATEKVIFIVVSDQPMGEKSYNNENATRDIPMKTINALLPSVMLKPIPAR